MGYIIRLLMGERQKHSLNTIALQDRGLAVGCRMIAPGNVVIGGEPLNGKQIADIFVDAARKDGFAYYPLTVDWATSEAEHPRHLYPCTAGKIFMNLSRALRPAF